MRIQRQNHILNDKTPIFFLRWNQLSWYAPHILWQSMDENIYFSFKKKKWMKIFTCCYEKDENCCIHILLGWETHVKDAIAPWLLTAEEFINRLQLTAEKNLDSCWRGKQLCRQWVLHNANKPFSASFYL